jgi:hypothetical protein
MTIKHSLALATLALLAACANTWTLDLFEAPEADVGSKRSFVWREGEIGAPLMSGPRQSTDMATRLRAVITSELLRKGYVETTDAADADMVVSYQATGTRRLVEPERQRIGAPSPNELLTPGSVPPRPASELPPERTVREGTVVVFAEDPASARLLWRGLVNAEIRVSSTDAAINQVVDMARHIAESFPARRAAP